MPKYIFQSAEQIRDNVIYPKDILFNNQELQEVNRKSKEVSEKFGYKIDDRQGFASALRLHILGTTDYTVDQVVDLTRIPHEELMGYVNSFFDQLDDTKEGQTREECAKNLARTHKAAFAKLKNYKFENLRADNIEYVEKYNVFLSVYKSLYIEHSQNMESFRQGVSHDLYEIDPLRQAYDSVYSPEDASKDENLLCAMTSLVYTPVESAVRSYNNGNYKGAALNFELFRNRIPMLEGKKVAELPLNLNQVAGPLASYISEFPSNSTDEEFEDYLYGITGTFDGKDNFPAYTDGIIEENLKNSNMDAEGRLKKILPNSIDSYASYFPEKIPDNLLTLSKDRIDALEKGFFLSFGQAYRASEFVAAEEGNLEFADLIFAGDRTIREIVGDRYANYSREEQMLALKLETMRQALFNPGGVKLKYAVWKKNPDNKWTVEKSEKTYEFKPLANHLELNVAQRHGMIEPAQARDFLGNPGKYLSVNPFKTQKSILTTFTGYFRLQDEMLKKHKMDMFDSIYIGDQTVNEIIAKRYSNFANTLSAKDRLELGLLITISESYNVNRPIFAVDMKELPNGKLERSVVPIIFTGDGLEYSRGMQTEGMEDAIRAKAGEILASRERRYDNLEEAEKREFDAALRGIREQGKSIFNSEFVVRLERIKRRAEFFQPASRKIIDEIGSYMEQIEADVIDACVRYDACKNAAKITGSDELREKFETEAEKIRTSSPFRDYENYLTSLELSFALKTPGELPLEDMKQLNSFMEEKTGSLGHLWPAQTERSRHVTSFAPLLLQIGKAADTDQNKKIIKEYLNDIYINLGYKKEDSRNENEFQQIGQYVLINGRKADDLMKPIYRHQGRKGSKPEALQRYLDEIAELIADALAEGKPVDCYISRDRELHLSTVPIRMKSTDTVRLSEADKNNYNAAQSAGHVAMLEAYDYTDDTKEEQLQLHQRLASNADERYRELCLDEYVPNTTFINNHFLHPMFIRYYDGTYPKTDTKAYQDPFNGEIRSERETPMVYIVCRLAEESLLLEKQGKPGYSIDQIVSVNALSEQKQKYADEFREICRTNDVKTYGRNLLSATKATKEYLDNKFPPEFFARADANYDEAFLGKAGAVYWSFYDSYQELKYNEISIIGHAVCTQNEFKEIADACGDYGKISSSFYADEKKNIQKTVNTNAALGIEDALSHPIKLDWTKNMIQANAALGRYFTDYGEKLAVEFDTDILNHPLLQEVMDLSDKDFLDKYNNGTLFDHVFIDYAKFLRIKDGIETGDINSCVASVTSKEEKEALRIRSVEAIMDDTEKELLDSNFEKTASERESLFLKRTERKGLFEKSIYKEVNELTNEELVAAGQLYDKVFGKVMEREGVRAYLAANPDKTEFDFFKVGNRTVHEMNLGIPAAPALNVANPIPGPPVHLSEEEILKRKAEILLASMDAEIPLQRETIRRNQENHFVISGREPVMGITAAPGLKEEMPELKSLSVYKNSIIQSRAIDTRGFTHEDWLNLYDSVLKGTAGYTISSDHAVSEKELKGNVKDSDPQSLNFEKIKSLFGPKPKYITEWGKGRQSVYFKTEFADKMQEVNPGDFTEDEFATLAYLISLTPSNMGKQENPLSNDAFIKDRPDHLDGKALEYINEARKNAYLSISNYPEHDNLLHFALTGGIKKMLERIRPLDSVLDTDGAFAHNAHILKLATDFLDKEGMEELKNSVMESLSDAEKKELDTVLGLRSLQTKKEEAQSLLKNYYKGKKQLSEEQVREAVFDISNFNDMAEKWYQEKQNNPEAVIPDNVISYMTDEDFLDSRPADLGADIDAMKQSVDFIKTQIQEYQEANSIPDMDERRRHYIITSEQLADIQKKKAAAEYKYKEVKNILRPYITERVLGTARSNHQLLMKHTKIPAMTLESFEEMGIGKYSAEEMSGFFEQIFVELSRDVGKNRSIIEKINNIMLPEEKIAAKRQDELVENYRQERINALKDLQTNQQNLLQLDEANQNLTRAKDETSYYFTQKVNTTTLSAAEMDESRFSKGQLKGGSFENFTVEKSLYRHVSLKDNPDTVSVKMNPDKYAAMQDLWEHPIKATDETNAKIAQLIHNMEQFDLIFPDGNAPAEEDGKVYGYRKLMDAKTRLECAVDAGNMDEIRLANEEYKLRHQQMQLLQNMVREMFPDLAAPTPNMDSTRNKNIPVEFMADVKTEAIINSLFLLGNYCKKAGISIEEMLENPVKSAEKAVDDMINAKGFDAKCRTFNNVFDAYNFFEDYSEQNTPLTEIFGVNSAYFGALRPLEVITHLEPDRNLRNDLNRQLLVLTDVVESKGNEEAELFQTIKQFKGENHFGAEANKRFKEGIKAAILSGGKLEKKFLPVVQYYENGLEMPDAVNYAEMLNAPNGYARLGQLFRDNFDEAFQTDYMRKALEETLFDYLKAHPEDMDKREYKQLEKIALGAGEELEIQTSQSADYQRFKENYRQKQTELKAAAKQEDEAFNKDIVSIQKDLKKAKKDQRNLENGHQDTVEVDLKIKKLENRLLNLVDKRLIKLNNDYALNKVTPSYLKARHAQLRDLKNDLTHTGYLKIPEFAPANSADAGADAKMIRGNVIGGLYDGHIKDMAAFKDWKMHHEVVYNDNGELQKRVEFERQLTEEQWQKEYEKEIIKNAHLPEGVTGSGAIARNVQLRNAEFEKSVSAEEAIMSQRVGNDNNIPNDIVEDAGATMNARKLVFAQKFQNGQAAIQYTSVQNDHVVPLGMENLDENEGHLFVTTDPLNDMFYHDIAEIIALGIAENRGGKIPGGGLENFIVQIAGDMEFRKILMPLADKLSEELNAPAGDNGQRDHYWGDKLIQMLDDRTIVKAYALQKNAVKAGNDMASVGINKMQEAVNKAEDEKAAIQPMVPNVRPAGPVQGGAQQGGAQPHPQAPHP